MISASPTPLETDVTADAEQQRAIDHLEGPCLVLAGPGSGKTRVIVERFIALTRRGFPPEQQLVLTYTNKAAAEMRERAEAAHGPFAGEPPLTTYHAFAYRVVRDWGWLAGTSPAVRIADAAERWLHVAAVLEELRPHTLWNPLRPHDLMDPLLAVIGYAKQELVPPEAYASWAVQHLETCADPAERMLLERHREVADVYRRLDERYRRHGVFDHDDCILYAERLIREQPAVRSAVAGRIRYVMVDEYQDTNFSQARLVETLVADHGNVLVVADDDQSIYKFRGASRANLERFSRTYPNHVAIRLTHNYRSTEQIVDAAHAIIGGAGPATRIDKQLVADRGAGAVVEVWEADDGRDEVRAVATRCRELLDEGTPPNDIAWLFRQHVDMQPAMHALRDAGVPYQVSGGRGFFQEREIKDAFALLAAAEDPGDSLALLRCLTLPAWGVTNTGRLALVRATRDHDVDLATLIASARIDDLDDIDTAAARRCVDDVVDLHALAQRDDVRDVFFAAMERSRYLGVLDEQSGAARMQVGANLNKLADLLETFADWSDDRHVSKALAYLQVLRDSREAGELASIEPIEDGIVLLTAHGAKGLEWPTVFIARCTAHRWRGRPPLSFDLQLPDELVPEAPPEGDAAIDEERRLFYVAATRARDRLVCTWAHRYPGSIGEEERTPFLETVVGAAARGVDVPATGAPMMRPARASGAPAPQRLSIAVSDLRTFKECPRRYEYQRRWQLPVRAGVRSWYGSLMHQVLHQAGTQRVAGVTVDGDVVAAQWHSAWDASRGPKGRHRDLRAHGEEQLRRYIASPAWSEAVIESVEEPVGLDLDAAHVRGRFDRVDRGAGGAPTVVDYKTGNPHDEPSLRRDLQLRAYAVAAAQRARADDVAVEFHYLHTGDVTRVVADRKFLNTAYRHLALTAQDIAIATREGVFPPKPSRWQCTHCDYRTICDEGIAAARESA